MPRQIKVTAMTKADIREIAALEKLCFSEPWSEASLMSELGKTTAIFLVGRDDEDRFCGYVGLNHVMGEGYINNIAVQPDLRRQGIAKQLIDSLLQCCDALELSFATLEVRRSNLAAINMYIAYGFTAVGLRKDFYTEPVEDGVIMTKYLKEI